MKVWEEKMKGYKDQKKVGDAKMNEYKNQMKGW
jgi:hypothetical protein